MIATPHNDSTARRLTRGHVVGTGAVLLAFFVLFYAAGAWPVVLYKYLTDGVLLGVWLLSAWGWGGFLQASGRADARVLERVSRVALGLGVMGLAVLGLGLVGWMTRTTAVGLVGTGALLAVVGFVRTARADNWREFFVEPVSWASWLWVACLPVVAIVMIAVLFPAGMLWRDEPHGYDVVAYHLQVPREWYELGRIVPLQHNVFSYFPFGLEMHDLLAMHLSGGPWAGMYLAQMMHAAFMGLAVVSVYGVVRSFASAGNATLSAFAFATTPYVPMLGAVAYNEAGLLLYGTLAAGWIFESLHSDDTTRTRSSRTCVVLAGVCAGLACGVKLTGVPVVLASLAGLTFLTWLARGHVLRGVVVACVVTFFGLVVFAPWWVKTAGWSGGNPVFPERMESLGRGHFSDDQVTRWRLAHSPRADQSGLTAKLRAAWEQIGTDFRFGYVLIPLGVGCGLVVHRRTESRLLLGWLGLQFLFWIGFTHLQGRFFVMAIPTCAMLIGCVQWRRAFPGPMVVIVGAAVIGFLTLDQRLREYLRLDEQVSGPDGGVGLIGRLDLTGLNGVDPQQLPATGFVVLVGDAKAFWTTVPTSRLRYRSVFDVNEAVGTNVVEHWLGDSVGTLPAGSVVVTDPDELRRLGRTYFNITGPTDDAHGVRVEPVK